MGSAPPGWSPKHERRGPGPRSHLVAAEGRAGPGGRLAEAGSVRGARPRGSTEWRRARVARGSQEVAVARRTSATRARVARTEVAGRAEVGQRGQVAVRWQVAARRPLAPAPEPERGGGENGEKGSKTYRTTPVNGRRGTGLGELCFEGRNGGGIHFGGGILRGAGHPPWSGQAEGRRRPRPPPAPIMHPTKIGRNLTPVPSRQGSKGCHEPPWHVCMGLIRPRHLTDFRPCDWGRPGCPPLPRRQVPERGCSPPGRTPGPRMGREVCFVTFRAS
jgi:hypothetical protein